MQATRDSKQLYSEETRSSQKHPAEFPNREPQRCIFSLSALKRQSHSPCSPWLRGERFRDHAFRKATIGSTPAARRAGIADANIAARPSTNTARASITGSHGFTPYN